MVSLVTRVSLWGRAGARCSNPDCRRLVTYRADNSLDPSITGDVCHIKARSPGGPRFDPTYPEEFRDSYDNLILLCRIDHKIVDDHEDTYTVDKLREMKATHEAWVEAQLSPQQKSDLATKEKYASIIANIEQMLRFDKADGWLGWMASDEYPMIQKEFADMLFGFATWIARQFWPNSMPKIEISALNLTKAIDDYIHFFVQHSGHDMLPQFYCIPKFYQISEWDEDRYERLSKKWESVIKEARERAAEIARALNLLLEVVREHIAPDYRASEGWFVVYGMFSDRDLSAAAVPRYDAAQKSKIFADASYRSVFNVDG